MQNYIFSQLKAKKVANNFTICKKMSNFAPQFATIASDGGDRYSEKT